MTIGNKIRYYRSLRGYTQAELGKMVRLPGDRIRQYENDVRTPKIDKLKEIADALDVDIEALSDIDIRTTGDVMHILFELEDRYNMKMQKIDGKAVLVFDDVAKDNSAINTYLNYWYDKKQAFSLESGNEDRAKEYASWRGRFVSNESNFEASIIDKIYFAYKEDVDKLTKAKATHCVTTSDLTRLLRKLCPDLVIGTITDKDINTGVVSQGIVFDAGKLQKQEYYSKDFAQFLYELSYFEKLGCKCSVAIEYTGSVVKIIYYIPITSFSVVTDALSDWLNYTRNIDSYSELARDDFETQFDLSLTHFNNIKEEIEFRFGSK